MKTLITLLILFLLFTGIILYWYFFLPEERVVPSEKVYSPTNYPEKPTYDECEGDYCKE